MVKKIVLTLAAICLVAAQPILALASCGGGGEGRSGGAQSEASTPPSGYTPSTSGTPATSTWNNTHISWDHAEVNAAAAQAEQQALQEEADRQQIVDRFDQQAMNQRDFDVKWSNMIERTRAAEREHQRADRIRDQLGNPDPATMAAIEHDFPTLDSQEALAGILTQMNNLDQQRDSLPPETYNAIRQELTTYYQDLQDQAATDRFNRARDFGMSVAVNAGSAAVGGVPGFAIGFTYNLATGGKGNAATGSVVTVGSTAAQAVVPGYKYIAPVADAYAQDSLNSAIK